jgi:hypothetical protein
MIARSIGESWSLEKSWVRLVLSLALCHSSELSFNALATAERENSKLVQYPRHRRFYMLY